MAWKLARWAQKRDKYDQITNPDAGSASLHGSLRAVSYCIFEIYWYFFINQCHKIASGTVQSEPGLERKCTKQATAKSSSSIWEPDIIACKNHVKSQTATENLHPVIRIWFACKGPWKSKNPKQRLRSKLLSPACPALPCCSQRALQHPLRSFPMFLQGHQRKNCGQGCAHPKA